MSQHDNFKFDNVFSTKIRKGKLNMVVEVDPSRFKSLMEQEISELYVGQNICKLYEFFNVRRYYDCGGFNHEAKMCNDKTACMQCAGNHRSDNCNREMKKCLNCINANSQ